MPTGKPTVTNEHKEKYAQIMGTVVKSNAPTPPPTAQAQNSRMNALLASLPKPKGIGDKMFIFTGKKKIIVDGKDREEEKVKMVDPAKLESEKKELEKKNEEAKEVKNEEPKHEEIKIEVNTPSQDLKHVEVKTEVKKATEPDKKPAVHPEDKKKKSNKTVLIAVGVFLGLGVWTFVWMYVFGYIPK